MGVVNKPYTFAPKTPANAKDVNANFDVLYTLVNGNLDDTNLGDRTIDDTVVPTTNSAGIATLLSGLANRIKTIMGTSGWRDNPATTLAALAGRGVPSGAILMWSGSISSIPAGWALCDGTNGTPDLRDRFIVGAGGGYAVGATGGEATHTLTVNELPSHSHPASTGSAGSHNHGGATSTNGDHSHSYSSPAYSPSLGPVGGSGYVNVATANTGTAGAHSHTISTDGAHTHTVTVGNTGGGAAHENRPPYYALAYIMKL